MLFCSWLRGVRCARRAAFALSSFSCRFSTIQPRCFRSRSTPPAGSIPFSPTQVLEHEWRLRMRLAQQTMQTAGGSTQPVAPSPGCGAATTCTVTSLVARTPFTGAASCHKHAASHSLPLLLPAHDHASRCNRRTILSHELLCGPNVRNGAASVTERAASHALPLQQHAVPRAAACA